MAEDIPSLDVVVLGGGSAGTAAAVAAARRGSRVLLLEKSDSLGGMASLANVNTICGLYRQNTSEAPQFANGGIAREFAQDLMLLSEQSSPVKMGKVYVLPAQPSEFHRLALRYVTDESRLDSSLLSTCTGITQTGYGYLVDYLLNGKPFSVNCLSIVDCSADALVAQFLGGTRLKEASQHLQRPAYIFFIQGVDSSVDSDDFKFRLALDLVHAVRDRKLPKSVMGATLRMIPNTDECYVSIDLEAGDEQWNPNLPDCVKMAYADGKKLALLLTDFFKKHYPAFANAGDPQFPSQLGIRESYRWLGHYELTKEDLVTGREFKDTVVHAAWPIELRETAKGARFHYFEHAVADIPLRSLSSAEFKGVYFAGRCISATHDALASIRVMGTCLATGDAAGQAASLFSQGTSDLYEQSTLIRESIKL